MPVTDSIDCNLIFYTNPQSRGQIVRWMLEEVGVEYQQKILECSTSMKSLEYLQINPMGKVPTIVHNGQVVTECAAICVYLADAFPQLNLAPDLADRSDYYRWLFFAAGPLESAIVNRALNVVVNDEQQRMVGYGNYDNVLDVLSKRVLESPYIAGDYFTAADVYVGSQIIFGLLFGSMEKRPGFDEYVARISERSAYKTAKEIDAHLMN